MATNNGNFKSVDYIGNTTLPARRGREYLMVLAKDAALTISIGGGAGSVPVSVGGFYEPLIAPSGELVIVTTGTFVVVS